MKAERNKYVGLIQAASQKLSEMKEKLKILVNEVEILKLESGSKDRAIVDTKKKVEVERHIRDGYRNELTAVVNRINKLNEVVEQHVIEIDKLNNIINQIEKEIIGLKRQYELAVTGRNHTGVQLIDRNDELCILHEKSNVQEVLLKKGELAIQDKLEILRGTKIDLAEL